MAELPPTRASIQTLLDEATKALADATAKRDALAAEVQRLTELLANTAPDPVPHRPVPKGTPDLATSVGVAVPVYAADSSCPLGGKITKVEWSLRSVPADSKAAFVVSAAGEWKYTPDKSGTYVRALRVQCEHGFWSGDDEKLRTDTCAPVAPQPTGTLDLAKYESLVTVCYGGEAAGSYNVADVDGKKRAVIAIRGNGSRNGAYSKFSNSTFGSYDDLWISYEIFLRPGFQFTTTAADKGTGGGGKIGAFVQAFQPGATKGSGGGKFFPTASSFRVLFGHGGGGKASFTLYNYAPFMGKWMEWEAAYHIGGLRGDLRYPTHHDYNHWAYGGNRGKSGVNETSTPRDGDPRYPGAGVRPLMQGIGNSRYVGLTGPLMANGARYLLPVGQRLGICHHLKMNTYSTTETFDGGQWMPGKHAMPNKDGVANTWLMLPGTKTWAASRIDQKVVWSYTPGMQFKEVHVGSFAGGNYEGCNGTVEVGPVLRGKTAAAIAF